ncbi:MAG: hypothetical protein HKM89_08135 [Gemmatimonadales bacterium]|nr:hypothetical protein [Gemmatimonadales bacterium]
MRTRQFASLIVMALYLAGCTTWRVQPVAPQQLVETERPSKVRVETTQNQKLVFDQPFVRDDSLMGYVEGEATRISLAEIVQVEKKQFNPLTIVWVMALTATMVVACSAGDGCSGMQ